MRFTINHNETGHLACLCLRWLGIWLSLVPMWVTNIVVRTWKVMWRVPLGSMTAVWQCLMAPYVRCRKERGAGVKPVQSSQKQGSTCKQLIQLSLLTKNVDCSSLR